MHLIDRLNLALLIAFSVSISFLQFVRGPFDRTYPHLRWMSASAPNLLAAIVIPFMWTSFDEPDAWRAHKRRCLRSAAFLLAYEFAQWSDWTPGRRRFDVNDLIATVVGTALALMLGSIWSNRTRSSATKSEGPVTM